MTHKAGETRRDEQKRSRDEAKIESKSRPKIRLTKGSKDAALLDP